MNDVNIYLIINFEQFQAVHELKQNGNDNISLKFLNYAQSSKCLYLTDSSVSYASAALRFN